MNLNLIKVFSVIAGFWVILQCGDLTKKESTDSTTATGTKNPIFNPSFEFCNNDTTANFWTSAFASTSTSCYAKRLQGTSFMPTQGSYFMELKSQLCSSGIYQESIDFSGYSSLKFDWQASGFIGNKAAVAQILLTGSGTKVLWSKSFTSTGSVTESSTEESVSLSGLTSGKLSIQLDTTSTGISTSTSTDTAQVSTASSMTFRLDNLQVCESGGTCYGNSLSGTTCGSSTSGGSGTSSSGSSSAAYCSTGYCYSYLEQVCCPRSSPYACKSRCYSSSSAAMSAGGCTSFKTTCY